MSRPFGQRACNHQDIPVFHKIMAKNFLDVSKVFVVSCKANPAHVCASRFSERAVFPRTTAALKRSPNICRPVWLRGDTRWRGFYKRAKPQMESRAWGEREEIGG